MFVDLNRAFSEFEALRKEVDRVFNSRNPFYTGVQNPALNIYENDSAIELVAQVPGMAIEDLDITFTDQVLKLVGKTPQQEIQTETSLRLERPNQTFEKAYRIPYEIDVENIEARLTNGLLFLTLPKAEKAKPQKIEIKA